MAGNSCGSRGENLTMRALYLLAILFVVDGHVPLRDMMDLGGLMGYYSFHLMLFAFVSGYFFDPDKPAAASLAGKAKKLLVPLYAWNLVYGLGAALLRRAGGFELGQPLSAYTLLLAPLTDGQHFSYNLGSWFVFPLLLSQALYLAVQRLCARVLRRGWEWAAAVVCLAAGSVAVNLCYGGQQDALPLFVMRTLILLPGYAGGVLYRRRLEAHDNLPTAPYMLVLLALRALMFTRYENLSYLLSDCTYYPCGAFGVYAGGVLAIAFWLRAARMIAPMVARSRLALYAGRHTFDIMMHHFMGFFAVNCVFLVMNMLGVGAEDFSVRSFRTVGDYVYAPYGRPQYAVLYVMAGVLLPLLIAYVMEWMQRRLRGMKKEGARNG